MQYFILLLTLVILNSCVFEDSTGAQAKPENDVRLELSFNHYLLQGYFYKPERIPRESQYLGKGRDFYQQELQGLPLEYGNYTDVLLMYELLDDPFTSYYQPLIAQQVLEYFTTSGSGALVGILTGLVEKADPSAPDTLFIKRVFKNSPADDAGILESDKILELNGKKTTGSSAAEVYEEETAGGVGTTIRFKLLRGETVVNTDAVKAEINVPTVFAERIEGVPLIQITEFSSYSLDETGSTGEFADALREFRDADTLLIDLRNNPGGSVEECLNMSDEIIESGMMISLEEHYIDPQSLKFKTERVDFPAEAGGLGEDKTYIFLADSNSASCAEIMLSAARERLQSIIVGSTTYGKGIGQNLLFTLNGGLAKITSLEFIPQSGATYHLVGIAPDHEVFGATASLAYAVALAKGQNPTLNKRGLSTSKLDAISERLALRKSLKPKGAFKLGPDLSDMPWRR
jgi:C-terminal peptidase prc